MQLGTKRITAVVGIIQVSCWWWLSCTTTTSTVAFHIHFQQQQRSVHHSFGTSIVYTSLTAHDDNSNGEGIIINISSNSDTVGTIAPNVDVDPTTTCPFRSRYYPRIVPIPSRKRRKGELLNENNGNQNKFWLPGQRSYIRNRFLQQASTLTDQVEWVDSIASTSKYSTILTLASLWSMVGNFTMQEHQRITDSNTQTDPNRTIQKVLALPNVDEYILEQFVHMVQWLMDRQASPQYLVVSYRNTVVDFMTIPTIVYTLSIPPPIQNLSSEQTRIETVHQPLPMVYDHDVITLRTKSWVQRVLVDTTICPFTKSITYSGQGLVDVKVPVGKIAYQTSQSSLGMDNQQQPWNTITAVCQLQSDVLVAIHDMLQAGPTYSRKQKLNGISSILLAAPGWDDHLGVWTRIVFPILEVTVQVLDLTEQIGIVCFHPYYQTPDGRSFPGFGHMHSAPRLQQWFLDQTSDEEVEVAIKSSRMDLIRSNVINSRPTMAIVKEGVDTHSSNENHIAISAIVAAGGAWQRRTPHATINVLRADQLAAAESKRSSPTLYSTNILRLSRMSWAQLQQALDLERNMK